MKKPDKRLSIYAIQAYFGYTKKEAELFYKKADSDMIKHIIESWKREALLAFYKD